MAEQRGGLVQNPRVFFGQQHRYVGFCDALFQRTARIQKTGARTGHSGPGGSLADAAFAADFNQLADRRDGIIIALPQAVAGHRAIFPAADFGRGQGSGWIRKFPGHEPLRRRRVHAGFGCEQIPIALKRHSFGGGKGKRRRGRQIPLRHRLRRKRAERRCQQQPRQPSWLNKRANRHALLEHSGVIPHIRRGINLA